MIYRPVRERDPVAVIDALVEGVRKGGYDETSLTSLSTADYSCVTPLVKAAMAKLRDEKVSLSVSSLRAYGLNEDLLADMSTMKAQGLTFAPEAGTQRMRDVITKNVTEEDITESAHRVFGRGFQRMKLYFMIGLPTEQDEDVRGIVETTGRVGQIGRRYYKSAQITASVSTHVPKPHTPFQWAAMDTESETARKQTLLAETARALRVDLKMHENHQSHLEGIFSRGDRACADLLERAFRLGCRFDGWDDQLRMELWDKAIDEEKVRGFHPERYLGTIPVTARLPWDHLDMQLEPDFLAKEYRKALKDRLSQPCGKPYKQLLHHTNVAAAEAGAAKKLVCYDCGIACDLDGMKKERLYYLRRMNAWTPPAPVAASARRDEDAVGVSRKSRQPTTRAVQGEPRRYRLRYTKLGRIAYLGHLDLIRHLPRIFRRAGLEIFYSVGFHPKPELSFGPALGLGIPSLGELLDVKLIEELPPAELVRRLNAVSLDGIEFLGGAALGQDDRALGRVIARAGFAARLPAGAPVSSALIDYAQGNPLSVVRAGAPGQGAIGRRIDVRKSLLDVSAPDAASAALLQAKLGWEPERVITFGVTVSHEGSARPIEVLESLIGPAFAEKADIARLVLHGMGSEDQLIDALDTTTLRSVPARKPPAAAASGA
jgi:radical SAM-linked protein